MAELPVPRTRRSLLLAAAAAGGALTARAMTSVEPVHAVNGDSVKVGTVNAGSAGTEVRNTAAASNAIALKGVVTTGVVGPSTAGVFGQSNAHNGNGLFGIGLTRP